MKPDGTVVRLPGGGPLELNLCQAIGECMQKRWLRVMTPNQQRVALHEAVAAAILSLKQQTIRVP